MKILPAATEPWNEKIDRRHSPKAAKRLGGYEDYRCCLRWEFDFACAFCLCHEADLRRGADEGTRGTGTFSIEHFVTKEREPLLANEYSNCFYACRYCNRDRGRKPNRDAAGRRLLNPCADLWADYFVREGDSLKPRSNQPDAKYTHEVYKLDLPAKIRARTLRKKKILDYEKALYEIPGLIDELRRAGVDRGDSTLIRAAALLGEKRRDTIRDILEHLTVIPHDAEHPCSCRREPPASSRIHPADPHE